MMSKPQSSDHASILALLDKILASPIFITSRKHQKFLRYLVKATLDGHSHRIKGYSIGVDVFGLPDDFDPNQDSIVRVEATRLRTKLNKYYQSYGAGDELHFHLPKGCYQISFQRMAYSDVCLVSTHPLFKLSVPPLLNPNHIHKDLSDNIDNKLYSSLTRLRIASIISRSTTPINFGTKIYHVKTTQTLMASHILESSINFTNDNAEINIHLFEVGSMEYILSKKYIFAINRFPMLLHQIVSNIELRLNQRRLMPN